MLIPQRCPLCDAIGAAPCRACRALLRGAGRVPPVPGVDSIAALFAYDGSARRVLLALKYRNRRDPLRWLGTQLAAIAPPGIDLVAWAPTSAPRRRRRGFDQAELLARATARSVGCPAVSLLTRRTREHQTGRGAGARHEGPVFEPARRVPAAVLLIDDIGTTGATLRAAAQALRLGGATSVHARVVAWTPPRNTPAQRGADVASFAQSTAATPLGGSQCTSPSAAGRR